MPRLRKRKSGISSYISTSRTVEIWDSPDRRSCHGQELQPIPTELYLEIFDHFLSSPDGRSEGANACCIRDLRRVALVCRFFCAVALSFAFRTIAFRPQKDHGVTYIRFCKSLNLGERFAKSLASYVQRCTIEDWIDVPSVSMRKTGLKLRIDALSKMPNLKTVVLSRTRLTGPLLAIVGRLPLLTSLTIDECDFAETRGVDIERFSSLVDLQAFQLFLQGGPLTVHRTYFDKLVPLVENLTMLVTDSWQLMEALISSDTALPRLQMLQILCVTYPHMLCEYLYRIPALRTLTMHGLGQYPSHTPYTFDLSRLQNLQHLTCPPRLISHLTSSPNLTDLSFIPQGRDEENDIDAVFAWIDIVKNSKTSAWSNLIGLGSLVELQLPFTFVSMIVYHDPPGYGLGAPAKDLESLTILADGAFHLPEEWRLRLFQPDERESLQEVERQLLWSPVSKLEREKAVPKLKSVTVHYKGEQFSFKREYSKSKPIWRMIGPVGDDCYGLDVRLWLMCGKP